MSKTVNPLINLISYIVPVPLLTTKSSYSDKIQVSFSRGAYLLTSDNAIYSFGKHYYAFADIFKYLQLKDKSIESVLVLGFGLGSLPELLADYGHYQITGIELDPVIIKLARKYMNYDWDKIEIIESDALQFVKNNQQKYDLIAMDIFIDSNVPEQFETLEYLENLKGLLSDKGILIFNRLYYTDELMKESEVFFNEKFLKVFPEGNAVRIRGNLMLINDPQRQ